MVEVDIYGMMEDNIKVNIKTIKNMVLVNTLGQMVKNMKVNGKMVKLMEKE
jgi:hypothetical protein